VCSDLLTENTSRAAAFSTDCSRCISNPNTPVNAEQQKSSFVMTSDRTNVSKASCVNERRTLRICRSAAKQALTVVVTCAHGDVSVNIDPEVDMMLYRFSRWRISAILNFRRPMMGSLKSPCTTSYSSSIETITLNCLDFRKSRLSVRNLATDRQTDRQTNRWTAPPHSATRFVLI